MNRARTLAAGLLLAASSFVAAQDKQAGHATPAAVFDAYFDSLQRRDTKAMLGCLTDDAVRALAGLYAVQGQQKRELARSSGKDGGKDDKLTRRWQPLFDVLDKHGLTESATKGVKLGLRPTAAESEKARAALVKEVKDVRGFLADYQGALDKDSPRAKEEELKVRLTEVKVEGDKATGVGVAKYMARAKDKDKVKEVEVEDRKLFDFVKEGGGWKIVPTPRPVEKKEGKKD